MPRRYYYGRRYSRGSRPKRKWSPTLVQGSPFINVPGQNFGFASAVLCGNSANVGTTVPVSTIIKVKNFKIVFDITAIGNGNVRNFFVSLLYVPQGFTVSADTALQHPEWLLSWRTIDCTPTNGTTGAIQLQNVQMSSRLARNLNSGDTIQLFMQARNDSAETTSTRIDLSFYCSFVTCNN